MHALPDLPGGPPSAPAEVDRPTRKAAYRWGIAAAVFVTLGLIALPGVRMMTAAVDFDQMTNAETGLHISPVRMDLRGKNRNLVGLGSFLVNARGACNDCHTNPPYAPGGNPFLGEPKKYNTDHFLAGGQPFGPFVSANLTPNADGLPADLTQDEFVQTIRTGHTDDHPQFGPFLQVMPWPYFQDLTDQDLIAIYQYLRSIPHAEPGS